MSVFSFVWILLQFIPAQLLPARIEIYLVSDIIFGQFLLVFELISSCFLALVISERLGWISDHYKLIPLSLLSITFSH